MVFRFCPSVFFYLCSVVPAIWIIEVDKFDRKLAFQDTLDKTTNGTLTLEELSTIQSFGVRYTKKALVHNFMCTRRETFRKHYTFDRRCFIIG